LRWIGSLMLLSITAAAVRPAVAETTLCTQITSIPWTISAPGIYCLDSDFNVSMASGVGITINASNVTLDMNRHTLTNLTTNNSSYGIDLVEQKNVVIKNGAVQGFYIGVALFDASPYNNTQGNVIQDIAVIKSEVIGIYVQGQSNLVYDNRVSETGGPYGAMGIIVFGLNDVVRDNDVTGTGSLVQNGIGIYCYQCTGAVVENNRVSGIMSQVATFSAGIFFNASSAHSVVRDNVVDKADTTGAGYGVQCVGIDLSSSTDITIVGNRVTTFYYGISVPTGSTAQTNGNVVIAASTPVAGATAVPTY